MPTLALSMIVRNAKRTSEHVSVACAALWMRSKSRTRGRPTQPFASPAKWAARVVSIPWENDFAKARNLALKEVHTDWVLFLDADEQLDPVRVLLPARVDESEAGHGVFNPDKELCPEHAGSRLGPARYTQ